MRKRIVRILFFAILTFVIALSLSPQDLSPSSLLNDKAEHLSAFAVISFLGDLAWPRRSFWLAVAMLIVGAAIEVAQGTSLIGRDADLRDFFADAAGVGAALILSYVVARLLERWRETA